MKKVREFSLTPEWPDSLPTRCHRCGYDYDIRSALEIGPGPVGRALRQFAPWMTLVTLAAMFATGLTFLGLGGNGGAMAFAVALVLPSIILWIIGGLLPTRARLFCFRYNTSVFHTMPWKIDNRVRRVQE